MAERKKRLDSEKPQSNQRGIETIGTVDLPGRRGRASIEPAWD